MKNRSLLLRNFTFFYLFLLFAPFLTPPIHAQTTPDTLVGDWNVTMFMGGMEITATAVFTKNPDGSYAGTWTSNQGVGELTNIKLDNNLLTFERSLIYSGEQLDLFFEGKITDNKLTGMFYADMGEIEVQAIRKAPPVNILGEWDFTLEFAGQRAQTTPPRPPSKLVFAKNEDGSLAGKWTGGFGARGGQRAAQQTGPAAIALSDIKLQGNKLTFTRKITFQDREIKMDFAGTVAGDKITGKFTIAADPTGEPRTINASATRIKVNPFVGAWDIMLTIDYQNFPSNLTVTEKEGVLSGIWLVEIDGMPIEFPVSDVKIKDNKFTCIIYNPAEDVSVSCEGTIKEDTISGFVIWPEFDIPFKGKRLAKTTPAPETKPATEVKAAVIPTTALVGTWELTTESQRGAQTSTMVVKEDMTATYTMRGTEVPIQDLKVEGDQVSFKVVTVIRTREITREFKGKLAEGALTGEFTSGRGSQKVTGKKIK